MFFVVNTPKTRASHRVESINSRFHADASTVNGEAKRTSFQTPVMFLYIAKVRLFLQITLGKNIFCREFYPFSEEK